MEVPEGTRASCLGAGAECSNANPLHWTFGGPARGEGTGLVFTPRAPCGIEVTALGAFGNPLRQIGWWEGKVGDPSCPGGLALIRGHMQAQQPEVRPDPLSRFRAFGPCEPQTSSEPLVKLAVGADGFPGWVIFDSDSSILVPAGHITLRVFAPSTWATMGRTPTPVPAGWTWAALKVYACPAPCGTVWPGELTEWLPILGEAPSPIADRVLIRPQRAKMLEVSSEGLPALRVEAHTEPNATLTPLSTVAIAPQGQQQWEAWGAPYLALDANQTTMAHLRWGLVTP